MSSRTLVYIVADMRTDGSSYRTISQLFREKLHRLEPLPDDLEGISQ